jgi:hypothetical protein
MSFVKKLEKTIQIVWFSTEKKKTIFGEFPRQSVPRRLCQGRREGGRAGNFYRGPRLNGGPEELHYGAQNRQSMKEPYSFYRGPSILSTALVYAIL